MFKRSNSTKDKCTYRNNSISPLPRRKKNNVSSLTAETEKDGDISHSKYNIFRRDRRSLNYNLKNKPTNLNNKLNNNAINNQIEVNDCYNKELYYANWDMNFEDRSAKKKGFGMGRECHLCNKECVLCHTEQVGIYRIRPNNYNCKLTIFK